MKKKFAKPILCFFTLLFNLSYTFAESETNNQAIPVLNIQEFIQQATSKDTVFEEILAAELALQFQKDLKLPARDIVLAVKGQYDFMASQDREEADISVSLNKLFPSAGTKLSLAYKAVPSYATTTHNSEISLSLAQPIAQNAFGKATRLKSKIIGLETAVASHQIAEAYEDYLGTLMIAYYKWYEAYENKRIGTSSYNENRKLLDNIKQRKKSKIALGIDVNKTHLQFLKKQKKLVSLKEEYESALNVIKTALRQAGVAEIIPQNPDWCEQVTINYEKDFENLTQTGRTFQILKMLEEKSSLTVAKEANDLLPSIDLIAGYNLDGKELSVKQSDHLWFAGLSFEYPFLNQIDRAEHEIAKIEDKKTKLASNNVYYRLAQTIQNLYLAIKREKELLAVTKQGVTLAQSVLKDETQNYTYGKVSLNDYIDAVNALDNHLFDQIVHTVQIKKLTIEYLRLTDRLISKSEIEKRQKK